MNYGNRTKIKTDMEIDMDIVEQMASEIAEKLNGGEWRDGKWYADSHRKAWMDAVKPYADEIERLREALEYIVGTSLACPEVMVDKARAALKGDE